jgi:hypothetical protein
MKPMNNHSHPQTITKPTAKENSRGIQVFGLLKIPHITLHFLLSVAFASLCIPVLLILDILLFEFTRPSCAGCANLGDFLTRSSTTLAFIQSNKALADVLHIFKKTI